MFKYLTCPYYEEKCDTDKCFCLKYQAYQDIQDPCIVEQELTELGATQYSDSWEKIFNIQKHFAARFSDVEHPNKETTDHWNKEYLICIEDEIEELIDYIQLYNEPSAVLTSYKGLKKEIIDILHFVMDTFITGGIAAKPLMSLHFVKNNIDSKNIEDTFNIAFKAAKERICKRFNIAFYPSSIDTDDVTTMLCNLWLLDKSSVHNILLRLTLDLLFINRKIRECISWKHWKKPNVSINYDKLYNVYEEMLSRFLDLAAFVFKDAQEIVKTYILKNIENIRRQKLGY